MVRISPESSNNRQSETPEQRLRRLEDYFLGLPVHREPSSSEEPEPSPGEIHRVGQKRKHRSTPYRR